MNRKYRCNPTYLYLSFQESKGKVSGWGVGPGLNLQINMSAIYQFILLALCIYIYICIYIYLSCYQCIKLCHCRSLRPGLWRRCGTLSPSGWSSASRSWSSTMPATTRLSKVNIFDMYWLLLNNPLATLLLRLNILSSQSLRPKFSVSIRRSNKFCSRGIQLIVPSFYNWPLSSLHHIISSYYRHLQHRPHLQVF